MARLRESVKGGGGRAWLRAIEGVFGWAFQSAFTFAKANQRAQMLQLLLPKASFWSTTNQKHLYPPLSPAFGKKNYPALPLPKNGSFFFSNRVAPHPPHFAVTKQTTPPPALLLPVAVAAAPPRRRRLSSSPHRRRRRFSKLPACKVVSCRRWRAWRCFMRISLGEAWSSARCGLPLGGPRCSASLRRHELARL